MMFWSISILLKRTICPPPRIGISTNLSFFPLEYIFGTMLHWMVNLLLLCPLLITGKRLYQILIKSKSFYFSIFLYFSGSSIRARHALLQRTIGTFSLEDRAHEVATLLMWLLPLLVTVSAVLELVLVYLFNKFVHP